MKKVEFYTNINLAFLSSFIKESSHINTNQLYWAKLYTDAN